VTSRTVLWRVISLVVWMLGFAVALNLAYLLVLFVLYDFSPDFLSIDKCLDRGGRWNYGQRACEGP